MPSSNSIHSSRQKIRDLIRACRYNVVGVKARTPALRTAREMMPLVREGWFQMATIKHVLIQKGRKVYSIQPDAPVIEALRLMAEHNVGALVVSENDHLAGIVTERDYARKIALKGRTSLETPVSEIMSRNVLCARPDQTVEECMAIMTAKAVRHLPVLEHKRLVGIVSIGDLVKSVIDDQQFIIKQLEHYIQGDR
jgi:CBS domain-containing protein